MNVKHSPVAVQRVFELALWVGKIDSDAADAVGLLARGGGAAPGLSQPSDSIIHVRRTADAAFDVAAMIDFYKLRGVQ